MADRKKITLYHKHFANIDTDFLYYFEQNTGIINMNTFIRESVYIDFYLYLEDAEDLKNLDILLIKNHYKDKTEWLREKMRNALKANCHSIKED